jgi:hypothetical protein
MRLKHVLVFIFCILLSACGTLEVHAVWDYPEIEVSK